MSKADRGVDDAPWQEGIRTALVIIVVRTVRLSVTSALPRELLAFYLDAAHSSCCTCAPKARQQPFVGGRQQRGATAASA